VCRYSVTFARELADDSAFAPHEALGDKDARRLAREPLGMTQEEFSAAIPSRSTASTPRGRSRGSRHSAPPV
jgi:hypothetical protein